MHQFLVDKMQPYKEKFHIIDGFPMTLCHFKRSRNSKVLKGYASYGYCASKSEPYYGFKGHLVISESGIIVNYTVTQAAVNERDAAFEITENISGLLLGDKGYLGQVFQEEMRHEEIQVSTPVRLNMKDDETPKFRTYLNQKRRKIETVIGQLVERFSIAKIRARTILSLTNRITRKVLGHTLCIYFLKQRGINSMELSAVVP